MTHYENSRKGQIEEIRDLKESNKTLTKVITDYQKKIEAYKKFEEWAKAELKRLKEEIADYERLVEHYKNHYYMRKVR